VGRAMLPFARAALDAVANARLTVDQLAGLVHGQVAVGMVSGCALPVLAELLAAFHDLHTGVTITLTEDGSDRLTEMLGTGRLDLALIGTAGAAAPGLETMVIADDALTAVTGRNHPLAANATVALAALRDQPLISLPRGTGVRAAFDAACAEAGFTPRIVLEASALPMVAHLAGLGLGVAIIPESVPSSGDVAVAQIASPQVRSRLELAWNPATAVSPAARALIEHAQAFLP